MATKVPANLGRLSTDQLLELWGKVGEEAEERRDACRQLAREYEHRVELEQAEAALAGLSDSQRAALAQVAQAQGIESQEEVRGG